VSGIYRLDRCRSCQLWYCYPRTGVVFGVRMAQEVQRRARLDVSSLHFITANGLSSVTVLRNISSLYAFFFDVWYINEEPLMTGTPSSAECSCCRQVSVLSVFLILLWHPTLAQSFQD
jgi:hypothetical protein